MINKNAYIYMGLILGQVNRYLKKLSGQEFNAYYSKNTSGIDFIKSALGYAHLYDNNYQGAFFSEDDADPTFDDYSIPAKNENLTVSVMQNLGFSDFGTYIEGNSIYKITNNGTETVTINHAYLVFAANDSRGEPIQCLLDHTKLNSPLSIPAGESRKLLYTVRIPNNPYSST